MTVYISPTITDSGLNAIFSASRQGLDGNITQIALGDGGGAGYQPDPSADALRNERFRAPVGGGERTGPATITLQALLEDSPAFWVREIGFILEDGTLFALWSDEAKPLLYKTADGTVVVAFTLALSGVPDNSVNVTVAGPDVNILHDREFALIIANQARVMRQQFHLSEAFKATHGHYPGA